MKEGVSDFKVKSESQTYSGTSPSGDSHGHVVGVVDTGSGDGDDVDGGAGVEVAVDGGNADVVGEAVADVEVGVVLDGAHSSDDTVTAAVGSAGAETVDAGIEEAGNIKRYSDAFCDYVNNFHVLFCL